MNTFNIITTILAVLLLILFVRTFRKVSLKTLFQAAKNNTIIDVQRKKAEDEGKTPFYFERGAVVIYARTQARAIYDYRAMKRNQKVAAKNGTRK